MISNPRWHFSLDGLLGDSGLFGLSILSLSVCLLLGAVFLVRRRWPINVLAAYALFALLPAFVGVWGTAARGASALFYASYPLAWGAGEPAPLVLLAGRALIPLYLGAVSSTIYLFVAASFLLFRTRSV